MPCGRINSVAEALDDPHTAARAMVETAEHPALGALKMLGIPFKFSDTECSVRRPPAKRGEHADEIPAGRRFAASSPVPSGYSENTRTHLTERLLNKRTDRFPLWLDQEMGSRPGTSRKGERGL